MQQRRWGVFSLPSSLLLYTHLASMLQKPGAIFLRPILSSIHSSCSTVLLLSSHNTRSPPASDFALSSFPSCALFCSLSSSQHHIVLSAHLLVRAVVERRSRPGNSGPSKRAAAPGQPEARATTGCFRTTNLGALSMESGLRAATAQPENRQRRFGLRLLSLPHGDQARGIVGAPTELGRRLTNALAYVGATESTVLREEPETLNAALLHEVERKQGWRQKSHGQD